VLLIGLRVIVTGILAVTGRFAHCAFRPNAGRFTLWTIRPMVYSPHGRFAPWMICPFDEPSRGRIVQRLGETSMGRNAQWAKRLETILAMWSNLEMLLDLFVNN